MKFFLTILVKICASLVPSSHIQSKKQLALIPSSHIQSNKQPWFWNLGILNQRIGMCNYGAVTLSLIFGIYMKDKTTLLLGTILVITVSFAVRLLTSFKALEVTKSWRWEYFSGCAQWSYVLPWCRRYSGSYWKIPTASARQGVFSLTSAQPSLANAATLSLGQNAFSINERLDWLCFSRIGDPSPLRYLQPIKALRRADIQSRFQAIYNPLEGPLP